jgi:hypothetical protein
MADDVQGIPDVAGLQAFIQADIQENEPTPPVQTEQEPVVQTQGTVEFDLGQFKNPKDLLKSYKEIQGVFTRTTQENKALKEQMTQLQAEFNERMELFQLSQPRPAPQPQQKDFDQQFIENPQKAVEILAEQKAQSLMLQSKIQDVLEEESLKLPGEFNERYSYAKMVSQQYPQLVTSSAGIRKLFQMGDKLRAEQQRVQAYKAVQAVFGEDVDFEKFRQLVKKDAKPGSTNTNSAYMPDSSTSRGNQSDSNAVNNVDLEISEAVKKGDPDAVLTALFRQKGLR